MTAWSVALQEFEESLDRLEAAVEAGADTDLVTYSPPPDLPAFPPEHRDWAMRLAERNELLILRVERLLAENPPPPVSTSNASVAPTVTARFEYLA